MSQSNYDIFYSEITQKEPANSGIGKYILNTFFFILFPIAGFFFATMQVSESVNYLHETARIGLLFSIKYSWSLLPLYFWSLVTFMSEERRERKERMIQYGGAWAGVLFALSQCIFFINTEAGSTPDEILFLTISAIPVGFVYALISTALSENPQWKRLTTITLGTVLPVVALLIIAGQSNLFGCVSLILFQVGIPVFYLVYSLSYIIRRTVSEKRAAEQLTAIAVPAVITFTGWQAALFISLKAYKALPPHPPECYIATAAARGHRSFVGSTPHSCKNGKTFGVNEQLQVGKLFELYLKARIPAVHRTFRKLYDFIGPKIAAKISSPLRADMAWLALKPFELIAKGVLALSLPNWKEISSGIYGKRKIH